MTDSLKEKLSLLPKTPGVYFHKSGAGEIIYVGKAAVLRNRVRQYFQVSRARDPKTEALVAEIADTDWMEVESELEALFLEAEMIRRYMPRYNILLRDDKAMSYIRIDYDSDYPTVTTTRRPLDDGARYYGPYFSTYGVRQALRLLRRIFPFAIKKQAGQKRATLYYHLGLDPGLEEGKTSLEDYRANLRRLISVIEGRRAGVIKEVERDMKRAAKAQQFELAAKLRNQLTALQNLGRQVIFSDKEFLDISKDHALSELVDLLGLPKYPRRIEGYDISHMQGTNVVASMVVFTNGVSDKGEYRKFKTRKEHNNDFYNMHETITRRLRFQDLVSERGKDGVVSKSKGKNAWKLKLPDLFLIDGGKGQLDAAIRARNEAASRTDPDAVLRQGPSLTQVALLPMIGLAKREEQIVIKKELRGKSYELREDPKDTASPSLSNLNSYPLTHNPNSSPGSNVELNAEALHKLGGYVTETEDFILVNLPHSTNLIKLLQRIRDESHRFAVSYHSTLKVKQQTASLLDDIPTIGPATRKKLLKTFGSMRGVMQAREWELEKVVGQKKAVILRQYLRPIKRSGQE
ncbi:excinuclease ABC subunit UvrC [Candidatus Saccharibacteria bacterium]|nr:excinuclease ABC subunit UvrC [Candidatus Saccharibacteria bacterium]